MIDLRDKLPRAAWSIGRRYQAPGGATIHYNGPPVGGAGDPDREIAQLAVDARYHMRPPAAGGIGGDGIQYHYAVLSSGLVCQLRDETAILWHCANARGNQTHIAIHLPLGGAQNATERQWRATTDLFNQLALRYGWPSRSVILGHREWPRSDGKRQKECPGPLIFRRLTLWRGELAPSSARSFRIAVDVANVRQGPGTAFKVAGQMRAGELLIADAIVSGATVGGDTRWAHRSDGLGFVHWSCLELLP